MNVTKIVADGLRANGFDGLVVPGECGCLADDLSPGSCLSDRCEAGYKHTHSATGEWIVSLRRQGVDDDEIAATIEACC
mgnify:CR=1 FL=1